MRSSKLIFLPMMVLILAILACGPAGTPTPDKEVDLVATYVAQTMAASEAGNETVTEEPAPPEMPPAEDPTLTATEEPTPTTSPAVLKIITIQSGNVWLWVEGIGLSQLTTVGNVQEARISDDGQVIAFAREGTDFYHKELWAINADGTNERILISQADFDAMPRDEDIITTRPYQFDWIPGTHNLAFNTSPVWEGPGLLINDDLQVVNAETGVRTQLLDNNFGGMFYYSPDGSQIAVVTPESLSLVNADGSNRRDILTFPIIYTYSEWQYYPEPVWASDSSALRVAVPPQDPLGNPDALTFVWHIPSDGSLPYMVGEYVTAPVFIGSPLISPDLQKMVYLSPVGEALDTQEIHWVDLTTASDTIPGAGNFKLLGWSPDSVKYVYTTFDGSSPMLHEYGLPPVPLTDQPTVQDIQWVDSGQFIFTTGEYQNWELRLGTPGGTSSVIASPPDDFITFDFSK